MAQLQKVIALVPMKAHSQRVPHKNLRLFCGKPLYHYIISVLLSCPYVETVYVDTDGEEIVRDIKDHFEPRVRIIWRPESLRGDFVSMNVIIEYDLSKAEGGYFLQTHSTNPLLQVSTVNRAVETFFQDGQHDSLFSVNRIQSRLYREGGTPINHDPRELLRTQDLPPVYEENSNMYIFSRTSFGKRRHRIGENPILFEIAKLESIDIDDEEDFKLAEYIFQTYWSQQGGRFDG